MFGDKAMLVHYGRQHKTRDVTVTGDTVHHSVFQSENC